MQIEIDGKVYKRIGDDWYNAETFIKPPHVIIRRLEAHLEAMDVPKKPPIVKPSRSRRRMGRKFDGLEEDDFKLGVTGTTWRRRTTLAGRLAQDLSDSSEHPFLSHAVYRRPQIYVASTERFDKKNKYPAAKFDMRLNEEEAQYGFYVEKNDGPIDEEWDWQRFIAALAEDEALRQEIVEAMREHDLYWQVKVSEDDEVVWKATAVLNDDADAFTWRQGETSETLSWPEFIQKLKEIDENYWVDLHLCHKMSKEEALAAGEDIADPIVTVLHALIPLYEASTKER